MSEKALPFISNLFFFIFIPTKAEFNIYLCTLQPSIYVLMYICNTYTHCVLFQLYYIFIYFWNVVANNLTKKKKQWELKQIFIIYTHTNVYGSSVYIKLLHIRCSISKKDEIIFTQIRRQRQKDTLENIVVIYLLSGFHRVESELSWLIFEMKSWPLTCSFSISNPVLSWFETKYLFFTVIM